MSGIYWLASYPKSGNTWLRVFLANYRRNEDRPANINELNVTGGGFSRINFDELLGFESSNLTTEEIAHYRPLVYEEMVGENPERRFVKIHDAFTYNSDGRPIFSKKATAGVIYLIRNPLDVAVSYAHHRDEPIDKIITFMGSHDAMLVSNNDGQLLPQKLLSWSDHVCSWVDEPGLNTHVVSYEDMVRQPSAAFTEVLRFSGHQIDPNRVNKAVEFSSFEKLKAQETEHGFAEKQPDAKSFFREGRVGSWRESMTDSQARRLTKDHREVMQRFGYLNTADQVLF